MSSDAAACPDCPPDNTVPASTSEQPPAQLEQQPAAKEEAGKSDKDVPFVKEGPLNPDTFVPPSPIPLPSITIEFCDRCRWQHRATWVSTELMLTFPTPTIRAITIIPQNTEETGGRFRVWLFLLEQPPKLIWDRKVEGGFPELKVLKQRIRDQIQPGKSLGHSDKK